MKINESSNWWWNQDVNRIFMVNQRCKLKLLVWCFEIVGLMVSYRWYQIAENYYSKLAISVYQGSREYFAWKCFFISKKKLIWNSQNGQVHATVSYGYCTYNVPHKLGDIRNKVVKFSLLIKPQPLPCATFNNNKHYIQLYYIKLQLKMCVWWLWYQWCSVIHNE